MATPHKPQRPPQGPAPRGPVAPAPPQPKILRIGIIQGGRIVEERLVRERISVTIGQSAKNMFVVPTEALPRSMVMFEVTPQGYALNFTGQMDGRISLGDAVVPLLQLQSRSQARPGGFFQLPLNEKARGKVMVGDMTLLFQFVTPPPRQPRPQLPPSVRGGFGSQIDGMMAGVLGGSLALHVAFFVYMLAFVEIPKNVDIEEEFRQFQKVFAVKVQPPEPKKVAGVGQEKGKAEETGKPTKKPTKVAGTPGKALSAEEKAKRAAAEAAARVARARGEAAKVGALALLTAKGPGGGGGAFGDALANGGVQGDMDRALKNVGGVAAGGRGGGAGLASGAGGAGGGGRITSISGLAQVGGGKVGEGGGGTGHIKERKIKISGGKIDDVSTGELDVAGANATIKRGYAAIKACYDRGLKRNPKLGGKLSVKITVTGAGSVGNVSVSDESLGDPEVLACMKATIRGWRFPPAQGGKSAAVEPTWVFKTAD
jgi:outer membrane biosynthesis protein TonB